MPKDYPVPLYREDVKGPIYVMNEAQEDKARSAGYKEHRELQVKREWPQLRYSIATGECVTVESPEAVEKLGEGWVRKRHEIPASAPGSPAAVANTAELDMLKSVVAEQSFKLIAQDQKLDALQKSIDALSKALKPDTGKKVKPEGSLA